MDVLIVEDDLPAQVALAQEMMRRGLGVICMSDLDSAEAMLRHQVPRAVIMAEWVGGRLSHRLALMSECRRPDVAVILLSQRKGSDLDEVPDMLPAVRAILGRDFAPDSVGQIIAAVLNPGGATRVRLAGQRSMQPRAAAELTADTATVPKVALTAVTPDLPGPARSEPTEPVEETPTGTASQPAATGRFWSLAAYRSVTRQPVPASPAKAPSAPVPPRTEAVPIPVDAPGATADAPRRDEDLAAAAPGPAADPPPVAEAALPRQIAPVLPHLEPVAGSSRPRATMPAAFDWPAWLAAAAVAQQVPRDNRQPLAPVMTDDQPDVAVPRPKVASARRLNLG